MAVHPTAIVEPGVVIGRNTAIWDNVHIRHSTHIGDECIVGEKTYIAYGVRVGDRVKINAFVYICTGVTIERGVMIAAGTVFTNDRFPRAATANFMRLRSSEPDAETLPTLVREGATIGAQCTIGSGLSIGRFAMTGMGSVVTRDVPDFHLVAGNPARCIGAVCACGRVIARMQDMNSEGVLTKNCASCDARYEIEGRRVRALAAIA